MQRCSSHISSATDIAEAEEIGAAGVRCALSGETGKVMVFRRIKDAPYTVVIEPAEARDIANREKFLPEDYIKSVTWLTNYGDKGIIGATIDNALCTSGLSWSVQDNNIATAEVTFMGHSASPVFNNDLPIRYWILLKPKAQ
jgi:hypothetical protein